MGLPFLNLQRRPPKPRLTRCLHEAIVAATEADLGMFSMFGRTGAPTKRGPPQEDRQIFVITKYSVNVG